MAAAYFRSELPFFCDRPQADDIVAGWQMFRSKPEVWPLVAVVAVPCSLGFYFGTRATVA